jgi:NADPH:quinone reductase-like Zn-dependent oxidoreductase/thioesterase domain-containing protein/acyl carrier protein
VIHLCSLDTPAAGEMTLESLEAAQDVGCLSALFLAQAMARMEQPPQLWLVTQHAWSESIAQAPLWGLARVLMNETPELCVRSVDLGDAGEDELEMLVREIALPPGDDEIRLRGGKRYVSRLRRRRHDCAQDCDRFTLAGDMETLALRPFAPPEPGPGQIRIRVAASGLNFKDVAIATGLLPQEAFAAGYVGAHLGFECAGVVECAGPGVTDFRPGDEVVALASAALSSHVITDACLAVPKPARLSFEEAATLPAAFLTAHYALCERAGMQRGETLLIHSATGGVGLAAIQLARRAGVTIFATAGSAEKREFLHALGIQHVLDSRSPSFAREIVERTGGRGVDIVLNSLAGDALAKSVSVLAPGGRFIELGKRDITENARLGLRPFAANASFAAVDVDRLLKDRLQYGAALFRGLIERVEAGELHPLPYRPFHISAARSAFRHMAQAKHIGKIVLTMQDAPVRVCVPSAPPRFRDDATYLITGGTGGFALAAAHYLVEHGARHLALLSRRGVPSGPLPDADVALVCGDVASEEAVARVLARIRDSMPPLAGVIHAAMALEDRPVLSLNRESFLCALRPKMTGAWNLHVQTLAIPLDFFVLFSSFTALIGNPHQANYIAGNTFLGALAQYRRKLGLPALAIDWGVVGDAGYTAQNAAVRQHLGRIGAAALNAADLLPVFGALLQQGATQAGVLEMDWNRWASLHPAGASPRFCQLVSQVEETPSPPSGSNDSLDCVVRDEVARILGTPAAKLDVGRKLADLGLDSLMAVELSLALEKKLGVALAPILVWRYPTIRALAGYFAGQLNLPQEAPAPRQTAIPLSPARDAGERPFFCILPGQGDLFAFAEVAGQIGAPMIALRPSPGPVVPTPYELAAGYVRELREMQPAGPYRLGGFCVGGTVAFEAARQLRASGEEVEVLVLLDPPGRATRAIRLWHRLARRYGLPLTPRLRPDSRPCMKTWNGMLRDEGFKMQMEAMTGYALKPYDGAIVLIEPRWSIMRVWRNASAWRRVAAGPFTFHRVEGTHNSSVRAPHAALIVRALRACFRVSDPAR